MSVGRQQNGIHDSWDVVPLRSLCQKTRTIDPTKNPSSSFEYVDVSSISTELWKITTTTRHTGATAPSRARKPVQAQDLIFATVRPTLKRVAVVPDNLDGQIVSTAFCVLRADPQKADPYFIYYSLLTDDFIAHMENLQKGASYPAVADSDVLEQEIAVPPLPEQRAIAVVLAKIQAAVETQDKIVATLKELKAATLAKLFREGIRGEPLKQTEIGEIPEGWEVVRLGDHCAVQSGGTPLRDMPEYWNGNIPWVKTGEINYRPITRTEEHITESGLQNSSAKIFPKGILLIAMYGQGVTRGKVAFLEIEAATNQACAALISDEKLYPGYLYAYCVFAYNRIRELGHGADQKNLSADIIREILLPLPKTVDEQKEIYSVAKRIELQIQIAEDKRDTLNSFFSSMLHLLMTGQVRVTGLSATEGRQ